MNATGERPKPSSPRASRRYRASLLPLYKRLLKHSDRPILVGPFRGEVGLEVLYWMPWLAQLREDLGIAPERIIPIARGGTAAWYGTPTGLELYAMRSMDEVRLQNKLQVVETGMLKQRFVTAWDKAVIRDAAQTMGLTKYHVIHPAWMYQDLEPYWLGDRGLGWLQPKLRFDKWPMPDLPGALTLPEQYIALRFYFRSTWEPSMGTVEFMKQTVIQCATQMPVVLLNSGLHADDHPDCDLKVLPPNVLRLSDLAPMLPETNLGLMGAVIARSAAFVGTYGGLAHLALRFGVPSVSLYHDWKGVAFPHRALTEAIGLHGGVHVHCLDPSGLPIIQGCLPQVRMDVPAEKTATSSPLQPTPALQSA